MTCACGKPLVEKTIATKTDKAGEHTVVVTSRRALVCATHGVVVWDPPVRPNGGTPNQTKPWSWSPQPPVALPYGGTGSPLPDQRPTNLCLS